MTQEQILRIFEQTGALQQGHFGLTSGLHSDRYFQCALVLQYPRHAERLCALGKDHFGSQAIDAVIAPAVGGIIVAYELARQLNVRSLFAERKDGRMLLRRGFRIQPGERILVTEDVVTTGGSVQEVIELVRNMGGDVMGVFAIVDRSGGQVNFGVPFKPAVRLEARTFEPEACPMCRSGVPLDKPGSRDLKSKS